jgi:hypothetical protein
MVSKRRNQCKVVTEDKWNCTIYTVNGGVKITKGRVRGREGERDISLEWM